MTDAKRMQSPAGRKRGPEPVFQSCDSNMYCQMTSVNQRELVDCSRDGTMIEPAESMNTMTQPEAMPGLACGMITRQWMRHGLAPRSCAASIWLVSRVEIEL